MEQQQALQIICLQTSLTQYHYQSYAILKQYYLERIRSSFRPSSSIIKSRAATLVILPECTGTWLYLMCVPMPQCLRSHFFDYRHTKTNRHILFIAYALLTHMRSFSKQVYKNYHSKLTWSGLIKRSWFSLFAEQTTTIYKRLFGELACETNCTIVAGSTFTYENSNCQGNFYNMSYVFEPTHGNVCLRSGKQYPVLDEISFIDCYHEQPMIYSIPNTDIDIGVLICADSWMPQVYEKYRSLESNSNGRRFLFIIVALNIGQWNIVWPGYQSHHDLTDDVEQMHLNTCSLSQAWFQYAVNRAFNSLNQRRNLLGYGVVCCQGILNIMNDIEAQGESVILLKRSQAESNILFLKLNEPVTLKTKAKMNKELLIYIGSQLLHVRIYPLMDMCHYLLIALQVRDDIQQYQTATQNFTRRHPLSCWLSTILLCFSGSIVTNFLLGESLIKDFIHYQHLLLATICWYCVFYFPFDFINQLFRFVPCRLVIGMGKEIRRIKKIHDGVRITSTLYPDSYIIIILLGAIRGCGEAIMSSIDRFVRGVWLPAQHEFLFPSFATKASFVSAIVFLLSRIKLIHFEPELIYLCIASMFIYVRIITAFFKQYDPFMPFENLSSGLLFNNWIEVISEAYRRATLADSLTVSQSMALTGGLSSSSVSTALMTTKKDGINMDGPMKGFDGKKRD